MQMIDAQTAQWTSEVLLSLQEDNICRPDLSVTQHRSHCGQHLCGRLQAQLRQQSHAWLALFGMLSAAVVPATTKCMKML